MNAERESRWVAMAALVVSVAVASACGGGDPTASAAASPATSVAPTTTGDAGASAGPSAEASRRPAGVGLPGSPSVAPSATPRIDVSKAFIARLGTPVEAVISGNIRAGAGTAEITGTYGSNGTDSRQTMTVAVPGKPQTTETVSIGGLTYERRGGLWFRKLPTSASGTGSGLGAALRSAILDVTDLGIETRDGQSVHHLRPRATRAVPFSALGIPDPDRSGQVTVDFYARDDGTPVAMMLGASWTDVSTSVRVPATMEFTYTYTSVGRPVAVVVPSPVWETYDSKRFGYSMAHPDDWEAVPAETAKDPDAFQSPGETWIGAVRYPRHGASLNTVTSAFVRDIKKLPQSKVSSNTATTVGGVRGRRVEWSYVFKGDRLDIIELLVVEGKYGYSVEYVSLTVLTADDRTLFDQFRSTFAFPAADGAAKPPTPAPTKLPA